MFKYPQGNHTNQKLDRALADLAIEKKKVKALQQELDAERAEHQALRDRIEAYAVTHENCAASFAASAEEWRDEIGAHRRRIDLINIARRHADAAKELRTLLAEGGGNG